MVTPPDVRAALLGRQIDGTQALARTDVPVLVTHGCDEAIVLPSMAELTLASCSRAMPSRYDGAGHMPFWEAPERFDRELAERLKRGDG